MSFNHKAYYETGELKTEMNIVDGKVHGLVNNYWPNGNLRHTSTYESGQIVGVVTDYDEDGNVISEQTWGDTVED